MRMLLPGRFVLKLSVLAVVIVVAVGCSVSGGTLKDRRGTLFETPEGALENFKAAFRSGDPQQLVEIFGEEGRDIISTGDPVSDRVVMKRFAAQLDRRAELIPVESQNFEHEQWYKLRFGPEAWPMRIPLINRGEGWYFAVHHAHNAAHDTRLAINQLNAIDSLIRLFNAQEDYFSTDPDGDGRKEYAQRIFSTEGKKDGLYWKPEGGSMESPLDKEISKAIEDGYTVGENQSKSYGGYVFRILTGQGPKARGGAYSYLNGQAMTKGFAILAYPRVWEGTGRLTYQISSKGIMYKKDLGVSTVRTAEKMKDFNPDNGWYTVERREYGEAADNPFKG